MPLKSGVSAGNEEIEVDQLLAAVYRVLEVGGFTGDRLHAMLRLMYRVGWAVGFDQGFAEGEELTDAVEKGKVESHDQ